MKKISIFFLLLIFFIQGRAQSTYSRLYYGSSAPYNFSGQEIVEVGANEFLMAGQAAGTGMLLRADAQGSILWTKTFGLGTVFTDFVRNRDTSCYIAGYQGSPQNPLLLRVGDHGGIIWSKELQISGYLSFFVLSICSTRDSGLVVCGLASQGSAPLVVQNGYVARFTKAGNLMWSTVITVGDTSTRCNSIEQTSDSGFVMTGILNNRKAFLIKLTPSGTVSFCTSIFQAGAYITEGLGITSRNGNIFAYLSANDPVVVRFNSTGSLLHATAYSGFLGLATGPLTQREKIKKLHDNGFLLTGANGFDGWAIRLDSSGTAEWAGRAQMKNSFCTQVTDKGFVLCGNGPVLGVKGTFIGYPQTGVVKLDSLGDNNFCFYKPGVATVSVALQASSVAFTQTTAGLSQTLSLVTTTTAVTYTNDCVEFIGGQKELTDGKAVSVYPNPSGGKITLTFPISGRDNLHFSMYDVSGKMIKQKTLQSEGEEQSINCGDVEPGLYLLRIYAGTELLKSERIVIRSQ